ncbi:Alpha/Beta hydrolase protein [Lasiosphaeria miniovina]|uniref:Carboxylic ester hydrolase n=1 Tax=Lasiosphaeria miniovina TaxID=1954250 RepID=A0AA40AKI4_9PEZI|nr:Alpha/Beta hydrolase protein [Lasiosphaeria miniovina]KAK0717450.1 Alpha/Beta hydrolase protein [Lasiosphaeria miniovina]
MRGEDDSPVARHKNAAPTATVKNGTYAGAYNARYGQDFFLGMPYAQKPARFTVAESLNSTWEGVRNAAAYPRHCMGFGPDMVGYEMSEDCLYINVIRPAGVDPAAQLPVAVWIHGGGLTMGGSADRRYNLSFIVQNSVELGTPIIAVSFNYRMAAFGFLSGPEVQAAGATNLGFRDQRHALRWIQENIAGFGGSPDKVTLWGESAGAISVNAQLFAYNGRDDGLFRAAVAQSGFGGVLHYYPSGLNNTAIPQATYSRLVSATACAPTLGTPASLECLRSLPLPDLMAVLRNTSLNVAIWVPAMDGDFIADFPSRQVREGKFPRVPILAGQNTDEGATFGQNRSASRGGINTDDELKESITRVILGPNPDLPALLRDLLYLYPDIQAVGIPSLEKFPVLTPEVREVTFLGLQYRRTAALYGDWMQAYQRRRGLIEWSNHGVPAYSYRFDVTTAGVPGYISAAHFQELTFVFYNLDGVGYTRNPFENALNSHKALAKTMSNTWVRFFVEMDPTVGSSSGPRNARPVQWPVYDAKSGGGVGKNIVWAAEGVSYEWDSWRAEGINWMIQNSLSALGS